MCSFVLIMESVWVENLTSVFIQTHLLAGDHFSLVNSPQLFNVYESATFFLCLWFSLPPTDCRIVLFWEDNFQTNFSLFLGQTTLVRPQLERQEKTGVSWRSNSVSCQEIYSGDKWQIVNSFPYQYIAKIFFYGYSGTKVLTKFFNNSLRKYLKCFLFFFNERSFLMLNKIKFVTNLWLSHF